MIKEIIIQMATNGFSILVIRENIIQDGAKIKTVTKQQIIIAGNREELHSKLDAIFENRVN